METLIKPGINILALIFSVMLHEMAHAWSADKMGDPTGKMDNRLSWNPVHHLDPFMSLILPALTYYTMGFMFGGAKPVHINPHNFKNPAQGWMISAALGPITNFALALVAGAVLYIMLLIAPDLLMLPAETSQSLPMITMGGYFLMFMILINIFLGVFNLVPIPPLDGSRVLRYFLPPSKRAHMDNLERYGFLILIALLYFGGFSFVFAPTVEFIYQAMLEIYPPELVVVFFNALKPS